MKFIQTLKISICNIYTNKLRTLLTMLGLVIGISSVIILVGISDGSNKDVNDKVKSLGTDIVTISIFSDGINYDDLKDLEKVSGVSIVSPTKNIFKNVNNGFKKSNKASIYATNDKYIDIKNIKLNQGRNISIIDIENSSKVCIIGSNISKDLFDTTNIIGRKIKIEGDEYTIIGVLEDQGESMGTNIDNLVIIPFSTAKYLGQDGKIKNMYIKIENETNITQTKLDIENYLIVNHKLNNTKYSVSSQDDMLGTGKEIDNTLSLLLIGVASISLIVGGIGVMNVMLVSVSERTKEIGIKKALGAKKKDILLQFLTEALIISIIGGIAGILIGILFGNLLTIAGFKFILSNYIILISFMASTMIGLIFGILPAYRASRLNPIDALRQE